MITYDEYQDYVIKDGRLIGEFELMYQHYEYPWEQNTREKWTSTKALALNYCKKLQQEEGKSKIIEIGCGLGIFSNKLFEQGGNVLGIDISNTAILKAKKKYPNCQFKTADILDFSVYQQFSPDIIVMAEVTWYVLDKLPSFIRYIKSHYPYVVFIHLLCIYPDEVQKYGTNYFTDLETIMQYFDMTYIEFGEVEQVGENCKRTYFVAMPLPKS
ncbi:MAG: class I SAM-dependent methyltransferase [Pseudomonadota bacterium]